MTADSAGRRDDAIVVEGVRLSHPERPLYGEQGITKSALAAYYRAVAPWILRHLAGRPLSLVRCPAGQQSACFYQKHLGRAAPPSIGQVEIRERQGTAAHSIVVDVAGLVGLVQIGVLEIHPWGSRVTDLDRPDRLIFDLDPDPALPWTRVVEAAVAMRDDLSALGFQSFAKTTGGKGLHVVVPLTPRAGWAAARDFARALCEVVVADARDRFTTTMSKRARVGRIFLDYLRNDRGSTAVAAWSPRARPGAAVSMPLAWQEVGPKLDPAAFSIGRLPELLKRRDPWDGYDAAARPLPDPH
jgi:bifunctional non-homologous end joining protein LigD